MSRTIPYSEYRRRVFNTALLECIKKPYFEALGLTESVNGIPSEEGMTDTEKKVAKLKNIAKYAKAKTQSKSGDQSEPAAAQKTDGSDKTASSDKKALNGCGVGPTDPNLCEAMCNSYFIEELGLNEATIDTTIARLKDANQYIVEACEECKEIADKAEEDARENGEEIKDDDKIILTPEDNEVLDQLFHTKGPGPQIDQIRDATVKALISEKKKSEEIKNALDMAQSKVSTGDENAYNETASRLSKVGPTSLMGAIMNNMSRAAIREASEGGRFTDVGDIMSENADEIKTRSAMLYAIMETGNQLEITHMNGKDVERLASNIFYQV